MKQIKGHTAYFGCESCVQKVSYIDSRTTFPSSEAVKRKDDEFSVMVYTEHQLKVLPLQELHIGLVSSFVLDSMHLVYHGVTKRRMSRWIKGPKATKLSHLQLDIISGKPVQLARYIPREFARKPWSLHELDWWKATEFRQFLLYTGIVVLKSELDVTLYNNFLCLSVSMFLLSNSELVHHYIDYVEQLLVYFVNETSDLYGENFVVYNVHSLTLVVDDVETIWMLR